MPHQPPSLMNSPRSVNIEITSRCNLQCSYCYYFNNPATNYTDLSTETWLIFFEELGQAAVMDVCLAGGEPFLRLDLPELLDGIVTNRMRYSILSNGTLINDSIVKIIDSTKRCDYVQVSLDGSCADIHDRFRGEGSFEKAVNGINILQQYNVPITVRVTLHRHNIDDLDNTAHFLLQKLKLPSFTTNAAGYLGTCRKHQDIMLTIDDRQKAMTTLLRLAEQYPGRITAQAGPLAEAEMWTAMEEARLKKSPPPDGGGFLSGCGCPWSSITVRSDGSYIPCTFLPHIQLGKINTDPLKTIWQNSAQLQSLRDRCQNPLANSSICHDCDYISYCTGNCPGLAHSITGKVNHPSPDACLRMFLQGGGSLPKRS